jgi:hypothetical protein
MKKTPRVKQIKKAIGRLSCPPEKVIPNKKKKLLEKTIKKETHFP